MNFVHLARGSVQRCLSLSSSHLCPLVDVGHRVARLEFLIFVRFLRLISAERTKMAWRSARSPGRTTFGNALYSKGFRLCTCKTRKPSRNFVVGTKLSLSTSASNFVRYSSELLMWTKYGSGQSLSSVVVKYGQSLRLSH
jgi:hypothetical protein